MKNTRPRLDPVLEGQTAPLGLGDLDHKHHSLGNVRRRRRDACAGPRPRASDDDDDDARRDADERLPERSGSRSCCLRERHDFALIPSPLPPYPLQNQQQPLAITQAEFARRKQQLMRRAMELAVLCNAQVGLVMFDDAGQLTQFSTSEMDGLMEQYARAVADPHERYNPMDVS